MIALCIITFGIFLYFTKTFLTLKSLLKNVGEEKQNFTQEDIDQWYFENQHPMTHKYDDINKVLKENNTSPCDEEE